MRHLLPLFPKPSRYLGIEEGSTHKRPEDVALRVALVFPDMYEVGMSYLGQKILYGIINERAGWQAERVFTPCKDAAAVLKEHNAPLSTLESDTPLADTHAIGFSVTHELCYTNLLYTLDLAVIPLRVQDRLKKRPSGAPWPLVIAGGGCTLAAEPLTPFVDVMTLGESEALLPQVLEEIEKARADGREREELLHTLARIPGVYIPEFFTEDETGRAVPRFTEHTGAVRRVIADMNDAPYPVRQPVPFGAVHNRLALEIGRGCTRGCRFCQAGSLYRPARERSTEKLTALLGECLADTGYDDVSFLSLSTGDFSALKELFTNTADRCAMEQISVSLPSLRVGSIDDDIMGRMAGIRRTGATLAPEAGSQRLRDVINKGITEEDLILHVQKLFEHGWQQIKLYFMIGLPTETDEDLLAIIDLCRKARDAAGPGIKRLQITAAVSPFVPKPHTPFQWEAQIPLEEIRRRIGVLLDAVRTEKRIKLRWHEPEMSFLEGVFSRGDRRLANVVERAYKKGEVFTSWIEAFSLERWLIALEEEGLTPEEFTRARTLEEPLPWDHLHSGLSRDFFLKERERALKGATTADCRYNACRNCGACDTKAGPSLLRGNGAEENTSIPYRNILNKAQRDQAAHTAQLDEYGRVVVRNGVKPAQTEVPAGKPQVAEQQTAEPQTAEQQTEGTAKTTAQPSGKKAKTRPPALAPHLVKKAALLRFRYARKGLAAYLSQLEIQHIFERALRRADVPLSFSQGFHPLPLVTFGRALPVGVASEDEWFAVYLREARPLQATFEAINTALPAGMRVLSVEELPADDKKAKNADTNGEEYHLEYLGGGPSEAAQKAHTPKAFAEAVASIAKSAHIPWEKEGKKGIRTLDARSYLTEISLLNEREARLSLDWSNGYVSPLALCIHLLESVGLPVTLPTIRLTKTARKS